MKRSTKIATAALLTIGIAGGAAAVGKNKFGNSERRADFAVSYIADELQLDTTQEQALTALKDQVLIARGTVHENMSSTRAQMTALVEAETFDQAKALELVNSKATTITAAAPDVIVALGNFMDTLNADQKAEILEFIENHHHRGHGKRGKWKH